MNENQLGYIKALLLAMHYEKELSYLTQYDNYTVKVGELLEKAINKKVKYKQLLTNEELFSSLLYIKEKGALYGII